jgi:hypothetical protein
MSKENQPDDHAGPTGNGRRLDRNTTRAKEVSEMLESCYCGRTGEIEDREPVATGDGGRALRCPDCGHLERLDWLPEEARRHVFGEAESRQLEVA